MTGHQIETTHKLLLAAAALDDDLLAALILILLSRLLDQFGQEVNIVDGQSQRVNLWHREEVRKLYEISTTLHE